MKLECLVCHSFQLLLLSLFQFLNSSFIVSLKIFFDVPVNDVWYLLK